MRKNTRLIVSLSGAAAALALVPSASAGVEYPFGFSWNRSADWTPGSNGSEVINNPGPDAFGSPVWSYELVDGGGGTDSTEPWFLQSSEPMVWDAVWADTGGVWARDINVTPIISRTDLLHQATPAKFSGTPLLRWINPAGEGAVDITGSLVVQWQSTLDTALAVDTEVLIALHDGDTGEVTPLFETLAEKPTPGEGPHESIELEIEVLGVSVDSDDSLIFTHRAVETIDFGWVRLFDEGLSITFVPSPATGGLLAAAGFLALRRRR